ncbi:hypothetical protein ACF1BP_23525 [Streptomyces sp. NPDC014735]|uniref:Uncharacterized protein n=1 Tax=Streptomyces tremellae TaxID=1124239 RepID=A0ABP7DRE6_9ACTN|nr:MULTISPECIES: hypothetical protein [Streptomyces]
MTAMLTETTFRLMGTEVLEVIDFDRIECGQCGKLSPFLDDADEGTDAAHDAGWHVGDDLDDCGCPHQMCPDCADEWCGVRDTTPRLFGMRVV